jgi:hypothetical protein
MFELLKNHIRPEFSGINESNIEWTIGNIGESLLVIQYGKDMETIDWEEAEKLLQEYIVRAFLHVKEETQAIDAEIMASYPKEAGSIMSMINSMGGYINGDLAHYMDNIPMDEIILVLQWYIQTIVMYGIDCGHAWIEHWMDPDPDAE